MFTHTHLTLANADSDDTIGVQVDHYASEALSTVAVTPVADVEHEERTILVILSSTGEVYLSESVPTAMADDYAARTASYGSRVLTRIDGFSAYREDADGYLHLPGIWTR